MLFADTAGIGFLIRRSRHSTKLYYQPHIFHLAFMFSTGSNNVDPCGVDTAVTENVGELGYILFNTVKCTGEKMAKIVREYLIRRYPCLLAQRFHLTPDITSTHRFTGFSDKDTACNDALSLDVI